MGKFLGITFGKHSNPEAKAAKRLKKALDKLSAIFEKSGILRDSRPTVEYKPARNDSETGAPIKVHLWFTGDNASIMARPLRNMLGAHMDTAQIPAAAGSIAINATGAIHAVEEVAKEVEKLSRALKSSSQQNRLKEAVLLYYLAECTLLANINTRFELGDGNLQLAIQEIHATRTSAILDRITNFQGINCRPSSQKWADGNKRVHDEGVILTPDNQEQSQRTIQKIIRDLNRPQSGPVAPGTAEDRPHALPS